MSPKKAFFGMIGILVLTVLIGVASLVLGMSMLNKKTAELTELKLQDRLIEEQQVALVQANKDIEKYQELESIARAVVPQDKDQAKTVREIITLAEQSGIKISSITFPSSTLGTKPPAVKKTTDDEESSSKPAAPTISQVVPVDGIPGLYQLEIAIDVSDVAPTYNQLIDFLDKLEQNRRTAQVVGLSITPLTNRNLVEFDLKMNVFIKP